MRDRLISMITGAVGTALTWALLWALLVAELE
jgi:hypothetical protein